MFQKGENILNRKSGDSFTTKIASWDEGSSNDPSDPQGSWVRYPRNTYYKLQSLKKGKTAGVLVS